MKNVINPSYNGQGSSERPPSRVGKMASNNRDSPKTVACSTDLTGHAAKLKTECYLVVQVWLRQMMARHQSAVGRCCHALVITTDLRWCVCILMWKWASQPLILLLYLCGEFTWETQAHVSRYPSSPEASEQVIWWTGLLATNMQLLLSTRE